MVGTTRRSTGFGLLASTVLVAVAFLVAGALGVCIAVPLLGLISVQLWLALSGDGDNLISAHVLRGPPDGG